MDRSRVGTGGMRRQRPRGGRRPKHLGVTRIKADVSMKEVAENRVLERIIPRDPYNLHLDCNNKTGSSYSCIYKAKQGMDGCVSAHYWFEVILADPE